jgi:hypothetical protein
MRSISVFIAFRDSSVAPRPSGTSVSVGYAWSKSLNEAWTSL